MKNLFLIGILLFNFIAYGQYQNHSGLKNRRLQMVKMDNQDLFKAVQSSLPSDDKLPDWPPRGAAPTVKNATIDSVVVLDDAPLNLTLLVYFSGIEKAAIRAEATGNQAQTVKGLASPAMNVLQGQSPLELSLKASMPENTEIQSQQLIVEIISPQRTTFDKSYVFTLNKRWTTQTGAANLRQKIMLEPVGAAAGLWQLSPNDPLPAQALNNTKEVKNEAISISRTNNPTDKTPRGPGKQSFSLWDNIQTDVDFELSDLNTIRTEIHPDSNPASETFYISPVSYHLRWSVEEGFKNFKIIYGANNEVQFHTVLSSGITSRQVEQIKYLVTKLYKGQNISLLNPKFQLLGHNNTPRIALKGDFQGVFQIDPGRITIAASNDLTAPVTVSWATDNKTKDMIVAALQNGIGLGGSVTFGTDSIIRQIPLSISFNDRRSYGKFLLDKANWRVREWQNVFPLPIKIRFLHALVEDNNGKTNHIYSWNCQNTPVPPTSKITFETSKIPQWLDNSDKVTQLWLEYDVEPCADCTQNLLNTSTTGLSGSSETYLTFHSMDLVSALGAKIVQIRVKSLQADPANGREVLLQTTLEKDNEDVKIGPLYVGTDKRIAYQYKVVIITNQAPIETDWLSDTNPQQFLNKAGMEKILGRPLR